MWRYRDLSLQNKISLIVVVGLTSAIIITVANFISFDRRNVERDLREEMSVLARITATRTAVALAFGDRANALENLHTLSLRSTIQHACVYNSLQKLFAQYQRRSSRFGGCVAELQPDVIAGTSGGNGLIEVTEPIFRKGVRMGYVVVASDLSPINTRTKKWVLTSLIVSLIALILALLITRRLQRAVVGPIVELSQLMDRVRGSNDLSLRALTAGSADEVGRLVDSFNEMLEIVERHNRDLETLYRELVEKSAEAESNAASLEMRNQHLKEQFGSAAHDLKQPLQAMVIFIDALNKKIDNPNHLDIVNKLRQATQNLSHLFSEILDVSKYEFDLAKAGTQPVEIKQVLNKLFLEFEAMASDKGLSLRFHSQNYTVIAHSALLERIIRNLLTNAIRYTERGGVVLGCRRRGRNLVVEVWDTGRGIDLPNQQAIFNRYVQIEATDRDGVGGFGMGLAIVKQLVDGLGYKLTLNSKVGRGSVFRLLIPLHQSSISERVKQTLPAPIKAPAEEVNLTDQALLQLHDHQQTRILLLDDDPDIRAAMRLKLLEWGFAVNDFADISSMLGFYRQGGIVPDLMISDFQLSATDRGDQAIAALRECVQQAIPAFIVTGSENKKDWAIIRQSGFAALKKPVKPARFRAMINHLLR